MLSSELHVLQFIETGGPGGAERVVCSLAEAFSDRGIKNAVLTLRSGWLTETLDELGIQRFQIESRDTFDFRLPFKIARLLKQEGFNTLHSHLLDSNFYGGLAARIAHVAHLATEHGDVHHITPKRFMRTKLRTLSILGSRFSAVSQYTAEYLSGFGIKRRNICCIGNPVSLPRPCTTEERLKIRQALGIPATNDAHWLWAHVANLRSVKDQATLLKGFAASRGLCSKPQSLIILGDGPERGALEALAKNLGIGELLHFLGYQEEVLPWLCASDGFILSSLSEAMPIALLEAGAAGLLLISSEVGGVGEIIFRERSGFLFPAGDFQALARRIDEALTEKERSREFALTSQRIVESHFSVDAVVDAYLSVY